MAQNYNLNHNLHIPNNLITLVISLASVSGDIGFPTSEAYIDIGKKK